MKQRISLDQADGNPRRCRSAKYDGSTIEVVSQIQFQCSSCPQRDGKGEKNLMLSTGKRDHTSRTSKTLPKIFSEEIKCVEDLLQVRDH